jgi:hypothetical protein
MEIREEEGELSTEYKYWLIMNEANVTNFTNY